MRQNNAARGHSIDISLLLFLLFWSAVISVRARKYPVSNLIHQNVHYKSNSCISFAFLQSFLLTLFSMTSFSLHTEENKNDHNDLTFLYWLSSHWHVESNDEPRNNIRSLFRHPLLNLELSFWGEKAWIWKLSAHPRSAHSGSFQTLILPPALQSCQKFHTEVTPQLLKPPILVHRTNTKFQKALVVCSTGAHLCFECNA